MGIMDQYGIDMELIWNEYGMNMVLLDMVVSINGDSLRAGWFCMEKTSKNG